MGGGKYKGKYIVYSLANFSFGGNKNPTDKDTMIFQIRLTFKDGNIVSDSNKLEEGIVVASEAVESIIKNGGLIISEYGLYEERKSENFPKRNRIMSGLSDGILVIEARKKSGTLITVDLALEQGKDIYALPGGINSLLSEGCNNLIKNGAKLVTKVDDILEDYSDYLYRRNSKKNQENNSKKEENFDNYLKKNKIFLEREEKIVYASLRLESKHIDEIMCETGFSIGEVIKILFDLEEKNLVIQRGNNYYEGLNLG